MKIYFTLDADEKMTNFRVAEAVVNLCNENDRDLNVETVAKMMLLQVDAEKGGEGYARIDLFKISQGEKKA